MLRLRLARLRHRRRLRPGALADCWRQPLPAVRAPWRSLEFLVLDAEMSDLDPARGELLSLAWVPIRAGLIELSGASEALLRADRSVGQSAVIHRLRDVDLLAGQSAQAVLDTLLHAARGRVLVMHNAALDLAFLDRLARHHHGVPLLLPYVDTLQLERRLLERRGVPLDSGSLALSACRLRYRLSAHPAHSALEDALATAELLLAHATARGAGIRLRELL